MGVGWCRPYGCEFDDDSCRVNGYYKNDSNYLECKTACINEPACIGFSISDETFEKEPDRCFVYGDISSNIVETGWTAYPQNYNDIHTSNTNEGVYCYKIKISAGNLSALPIIATNKISCLYTR